MGEGQFEKFGGRGIRGTHPEFLKFRIRGASPEFPFPRISTYAAVFPRTCFLIFQ